MKTLSSLCVVNSDRLTRWMRQASGWAPRTIETILKVKNILRWFIWRPLWAHLIRPILCSPHIAVLAIHRVLFLADAAFVTLSNFSYLFRFFVVRKLYQTIVFCQFPNIEYSLLRVVCKWKKINVLIIELRCHLHKLFGYRKCGVTFIHFRHRRQRTKAIWSWWWAADAIN